MRLWQRSQRTTGPDLQVHYDFTCYLCRRWFCTAMFRGKRWGSRCVTKQVQRTASQTSSLTTFIPTGSPLPTAGSGWEIRLYRFGRNLCCKFMLILKTKLSNILPMELSRWPRYRGVPRAEVPKAEVPKAPNSKRERVSVLDCYKLICSTILKAALSFFSSVYLRNHVFISISEKCKC